MKMTMATSVLIALYIVNLVMLGESQIPLGTCGRAVRNLRSQEPMVRVQTKSSPFTSVPAASRSLPSVVSIWKRGTHRCSGVVLPVEMGKPASDMILTTAECVVAMRDNPNLKARYQVKAGSNSLGMGGVTIGVEEVIVHGTFDPATLKDNIAIVKLAGSLPFNRAIQPICLVPRWMRAPEGKRGIVASWRGGNGAGPIALTQSQGTLNEIISMVTFSARLCGEVDPGFLRDRMFCARDYVFGESGSPYLKMHSYSDGDAMGVQGLVSKHVTDGPRMGTIFVNVASYFSWITRKVMQKSALK